MATIQLRDAIYRNFIEPKSQDPDLRRREFILNVLIYGLGLASLSSFTSVLIHMVIQPEVLYASSLLVWLGFGSVVGILIWLLRKGHTTFLALLLVGLIVGLATYYLFAWSFELPITQMLFVVTIVLAGVLFRAIAAFITSTLVSILFMTVAIMQAGGHLFTNTSWLSSDLDTADAVGGVAIFSLVGLVTWLANSEIDRLLIRARASEASLAKERDNLEVKVKERTQDLEKVHLVRLIELQRFSEFGKLTAGILHDVANPLTVASLNIGQLEDKYQPYLVKQAAESLQYVERYVEAARKQLLLSGEVSTFKIGREINQVLGVISHQAHKQKVQVAADISPKLKLTGDPVKFSQIVANLVTNAIESYDDFLDNSRVRQITLSAKPYRSGVCLIIQDFGKGMSAAQTKQIFQTFYSTKATDKPHMGLGLSLIKQIIETDFRGRLLVKSSLKLGTTFTVYLLNNKA